MRSFVVSFMGKTNYQLPYIHIGPLSPALMCAELADTRVITIDCFSLVGASVDFATCSFDGGLATPCELYIAMIYAILFCIDKVWFIYKAAYLLVEHIAKIKTSRIYVSDDPFLRFPYVYVRKIFYFLLQNWR